VPFDDGREALRADEFEARAGLEAIVSEDAKKSEPATKDATPPGWGHDELTRFWDHARANQLGTFANKRGAYERLAEIDRAFVTICNGWTNPDSELTTMLFLRCHSAFRVAAGLAAAGQAVECYSLNRTALEFAGCGLHIFRNPKDGMVWLNRHKDAASTETAKQAFSHRKVLASVRAANRHAGDRFETLYQQTIDFGAHPNQLSVTGHMAIVDEADRREMRAIYLHGDGLALDMALKTTARCGVCSLELMQCVYNARFELLGVNAAMPHLKRGL
jgi:hypothetical protein